MSVIKKTGVLKEEISGQLIPFKTPGKV